MASTSPKITDSFQFPENLDVSKPFFGLGIVGLIASGIGYFVNAEQFFFSYLTSFIFFTSIALASLILLMIHHITRASWGTVIRRIPETFVSNIWIWAIFVIPVLLGMHTLYHWTHTEAVAHDSILAGKTGYLNVPFFIIRQFIYFGIWGFLGYKLHKTSVEMDRTNDWGLTQLLRNISAPGIVAFALTTAFASFDWVMSLDPHWYSTMFGVYFFAMSFQAYFPILILMVFWMRRKGILEHTILKSHVFDLGAWFFGFTVFYAYIAFSQFLLIYYANIPEETIWYYHRLEGGWQYIGYALVLCRFLIPFVLLMNRDMKHRYKVLITIAVLVLFMHFAELFWIIMPNFHHHGFTISWLDFATLFGLGGIFMGLFFLRFKKHNLIPINDPKLSESLHKEYHH